MVPVIPNPKSIRSFPNVDAFERWLAANHATVNELWLKIHKKNSGLPTVTYTEALDVALCHGWIDGLKKSFDATSFLQRFTPRTATSIWSQVNTQHIERLTTAGRMQPAGQHQIDLAKSDGRGNRAYASGRDMTTPDDLLRAVTANAAAKKTYDVLSKLNLYAMAFRVVHTRKPDARARRIANLVAMLARGETLYDNGKKNPTKIFSTKTANATTGASKTNTSEPAAKKSTSKTGTNKSTSKTGANKFTSKPAAKKSTSKTGTKKTSATKSAVKTASKKTVAKEPTAKKLMPKKAKPR